MKPFDFVRRVLPSALKAALKRRLGMPETRLHADWKILAPIGPVRRPHVVVDIGSNAGWFFHCWKDWCPEAVVHAFEPQADIIEESRRLYGSDPRIHFNQAGVGSERGTLELKVMEASRVSSSFLPHVPQSWKSIEYETGTIRAVSVPVIRLDDYAAEHAIDSVFLIKIDVQGFELEVLRGAEEMLATTDYVFVESAIQPLYEGAPRFTDVFAYLTAHGFHLMAMRAWHRGNHVLIESDMLFRRNGLAPPADRGVDKVMEQVG